MSQPPIPQPPNRAAIPVAPEPLPVIPYVNSGVAFLIFAYDVGYSIDLDEAERLISAARPREPLRRPRRAPQWLQFEAPPLRMAQPAAALNLGRFRTAETVEVVWHEFGCLSLTYRVPLSGSLSELIAFSNMLYENPDLLKDSRHRVEGLLRRTHRAVLKPSLHPFVEDYVIFEFSSLSGDLQPRELLRSAPRELAMLLRSEPAGLSDQEIADALSARASYSNHDLTLIDWNAALIIDPQPDDVRTVLEYVNVELLELRYLDRQLDQALDEAYKTLALRRPFSVSPFNSHRGKLGRIARLQADSAALFEAVHNPLKLLGDQFLARVYRIASHRLHLTEWDNGILRKLQTLDSIYGKMNDQQAAVRMELLEWIIIILIAVSIALPFVTHGKG